MLKDNNLALQFHQKSIDTLSSFRISAFSNIQDVHYSFFCIQTPTYCKNEISNNCCVLEYTTHGLG